MASWKAARSGIRGIFDKTSGGGGSARAAIVTMVYGWEWAASWIKKYLFLGLHDNGLNNYLI